jgi:hypothetical protein
LTIDDDDSRDNQKASIYVFIGQEIQSGAPLEAAGVRVEGEKRAEEDKRQVRREK